MIYDQIYSFICVTLTSRFKKQLSQNCFDFFDNTKTILSQEVMHTETIPIKRSTIFVIYVDNVMTTRLIHVLKEFLTIILDVLDWCKQSLDLQ